MSHVRDLPQAEFEVMDILWQRGEATVREVRAALNAEKQLAYTTVATLLARLQGKGYVASKQQKSAYVFRPIIPREHVVQRKVHDLVQRILCGDLGPLAAYIAENRKLTPEQLEALEEIVRSRSEEEEQDGTHQ